jgi:hypothetical protein
MNKIKIMKMMVAVTLLAGVLSANGADGEQAKFDSKYYDDYLFIEAGGFSDKNPAGWKSPLVVMKKK